MCRCDIFLWIISQAKRLWNWIWRTCCRCVRVPPEDASRDQNGIYDNEEEEEETTYIEAAGLTAREVISRISMINNPSLRRELATQMLPYVQDSGTRPPNIVTDFSLRDEGSIVYAAYALQSINERYNLYLAYFYSNARSTSSAFDLLHQRMHRAWPHRIPFDERIHQ